MFARSLIVLLALAFAAPGAPDVTKTNDKADVFPNKVVGDLSGYYVCEGQEGPGVDYKGIAVITKKGDMYQMQWIIGANLTLTGVGIRNDNTLAAGWAVTAGEKGNLIRGVNMYRIEPGPKLIGRWAVLPSDGTLRTETLTFLKKMEED